MIELFDIWAKWLKPIAIFCCIAVVLSIIITMPFIMKPYYKSSLIFYPSNPESMDRSALFNQKESGTTNIFGDKDDINRALSIANSYPLIDHLIKKFDLTKHYKIKAKNDGLIMHYTAKELKENYKAIKNDNGAVELTMYDTDANLAAEMLKEATQKIDFISRNMIKENKTKIVAELDKILETKKQNSEATDVTELKNIRDQYQISASDNFTTLYIIEDAGASAKKAKPVRWLIVVATAIGSFIFATLMVIILEMFTNAKQRYHSKLA